MIPFGPVPSRRLGRSLGINNIPPKVCTYSCVYCQLGRTVKMDVERKAFYDVDRILREVRDQVKKASDLGQTPDYLTFVPDGEPTLDVCLGSEIELLKAIGIRIAVITNASLIGCSDVREEIMKADWVSLKVDAVRDSVWRKVDRPHRKLELDLIFDGILDFGKKYKGELVTETMLVRGVNEDDSHLNEIGEFLALLKPSKAYISIPIRPPAEKWVRAPSEDVLNRAYQLFRRRIDSVEFLAGYEGNAFVSTGDVKEDLLNITSVHPMREDAVKSFLAKANADWTIVQNLINGGQLVETNYDGKRFFLRRLHSYKA